MASHGKKYLSAREKIDNDTLYEPLAAINLLKEVGFASFDETVEFIFEPVWTPARQISRSATWLLCPMVWVNPSR